MGRVANLAPFQLGLKVRFKNRHDTLEFAGHGPKPFSFFLSGLKPSLLNIQH